MIIENGTIEFQVTTGGGGFDESGYPVAPEKKWDDPIPCQYYPNKYDAQGRVIDEHATIRSYTILIEIQPVTTDRIRIKDREGNEVGEFQVISSEPLDAVCQTKITV